MKALRRKRPERLDFSRRKAPMTTVSYDFDVIAWAREQAHLLRTGQLDLLDIEHIAEEIEDVGKSEKRELRNRMAVLLSHLLKWQYQPEYQGNSWRRTIKVQREDIADCFIDTPSLKPDLASPQWRERVWVDAVNLAMKETGLRYEVFPESCPWTLEQIMDVNFWPD